MCSEARSTRVCRICGVEKPLNKSNFYWRSDNNSFRTECIECTQERALINKLGVDFKRYHQMVKSQDHRCAICDSKLESSRYSKFAVDHCHKTGKVRGLLCTQCNTALGLMKDSVHRLESAIRYLQLHTSEDIVSPV